MSSEQHEQARLCASCGTPLTPGLRFCASCGNWIGADDPVVEDPVAEVPVVEEPVADEPVVEDEPVAVVEPPVAVDKPVVREEQTVRELPALAVHEPLTGDLAMRDVHSLPAATQVEERPVTFAREPLSWVWRVLLAIALLLVFAAAAAALRLTR
jgi:hypothetical protein